MLWTDILLRLALAVGVGLLVGVERERHHHPAGMKTHIMVCMGAAIVSMIQLHMTADTAAAVTETPELAQVLKSDAGRLGAQVISGIGFLGAGTILQKKGSITGLTTAATLWLVACIGLAVGMGYYVISLLSIAMVMLILVGLRFFQRHAFRARQTTLEIEFIRKREAMDMIEEYFSEQYIQTKQIEFLEEREETLYHGQPVFRCSYTIVLPRTVELPTLLRALQMREPILRASETTE